MYNNSLIFMVTPTTANVAANGVLPLSSIARRRGRTITSETDSILLGAAGYYKINATITFTAPAAGNVTIVARKNGADIQGLTATETITTATTENRTITLSGVIRVLCSEASASITLVNTGVAIATSNIAVDIEYLD